MVVYKLNPWEFKKYSIFEGVEFVDEQIKEDYKTKSIIDFFSQKKEVFDKEKKYVLYALDKANIPIRDISANNKNIKFTNNLKEANCFLISNLSQIVNLSPMIRFYLTTMKNDSSKYYNFTQFNDYRSTSYWFNRRPHNDDDKYMSEVANKKLSSENYNYLYSHYLRTYFRCSEEKVYELIDHLKSLEKLPKNDTSNQAVISDLKEVLSISFLLRNVNKNILLAEDVVQFEDDIPIENGSFELIYNLISSNKEDDVTLGCKMLNNLYINDNRTKLLFTLVKMTNLNKKGKVKYMVSNVLSKKLFLDNICSLIKEYPEDKCIRDIFDKKLKNALSRVINIDNLEINIK